MRIGLLGTTTVCDDTGAPVDVGGAKQRAVLAQLALAPNTAVTVDRLAEGIWGEAVPSRYRQNLQVYVSTLRRALEPSRAPKTASRIVGHREAYELVAAPVEVDVTRFLEGTRDGVRALDHGRPSAASARLTAALAEWRGSPLADLLDQPFAADWVTTLDEERLVATEARFAADLGRGRAADLVPELRRLVEEHPDRERLWEQLMLALYRGGRQADALTVFREARARLADEVGIDPGPDLARTADRILHQDPDLLVTPPATSEGPAVPVPLTPLLGPGPPVTQAVDLVTSAERLVVLTGPGGVGKTRCGLAAAAALGERGRMVRWVPLEDVRTVEEAVAALATALDLADLQDLSPVSGCDDVLLLDNLEQLPGLGPHLQRVLEAVPTLQVLATSRSPLGVVGERVVPVAPLDVRTDAVLLFAERARGVDPGFDERSSHPSVVRICSALDGLPLAIELAAARMSLFTADELADELMARPEPSASRGGRQESVHDLVQWSVELLPDRSQALFRRLCACPGSFDLESAEAVGATLELSPADVRRAVDDLSRAALLRSTETPAGRRFAMLNTVRGVGEDLLQPGEGASAWGALTDLWLARAGSVDVAAEPDGTAIAAAAVGLPTTLLVLDQLRSQGRLDDAARVLLAQRRGLAVAGRDDLVLQCSLDLVDAGLAEPMRTVVRVVAGGAAYNCYDDRAEVLLSSVDDLRAEDTVWRVFGNNWLCVLHADAGDADAARTHSRLAIAAAEADGHPQLLRRAHSAAGWAALKAGDYASAAEHARAQVPWVTSDSDRVLALLDQCLAQLFLEKTDGAVRTAQQALAMARRIGPSQHLADAQQFLCWGLVQAEDPLGALEPLLAAMRGMRTRSDPGWLLTNAAAVGMCAVMLGRVDEGSDLLRLSSGLAFAQFEAPSALPEPLLPTAARHEIPTEHDPTDPPVFETVAEVVDRAIGLAEVLTA